MKVPAEFVEWFSRVDTQMLIDATRHSESAVDELAIRAWDAALSGAGAVADYGKIESADFEPSRYEIAEAIRALKIRAEP